MSESSPDHALLDLDAWKEQARPVVEKMCSRGNALAPEYLAPLLVQLSPRHIVEASSWLENQVGRISTLRSWNREAVLHRLAANISEENCVATLAWAQHILEDAGPFGIDVRKESGTTPLWFAATSQHGAPLVLLLLNAGASPNAEDDYGCTPLFYAYPSNVPLLCAAGANLEHKNSRGFTPLWWAVLDEAQVLSKSEQTQMVGAFLRAGADASAPPALPARCAPLAEKVRNYFHRQQLAQVAHPSSPAAKARL